MKFRSEFNRQKLKIGTIYALILNRNTPHPYKFKCMILSRHYPEIYFGDKTAYNVERIPLNEGQEGRIPNVAYYAADIYPLSELNKC